MAFLSVLFVLVAKGVAIGVAEENFNDKGSLSVTWVIISLQFIPQIMLALLTTIGFSWSSMKLIFYHPETLLLPTGKYT